MDTETINQTVETYRAKVKGGRLVMDEPTQLPDGTEIQLVQDLPADQDTLSAEERALLHRSLEQSLQEHKRGEVIPIESVLKELEESRT